MRFAIVFIIGMVFSFILKKKLLNNNYILLVSVLLILFMVDFFGGFEGANKAMFFFSLPFVLFESGEKTIFKKYIFLFIAGLFLSMISCYYFRKQTIFESFWVYNTLYGILFYFLIRSLNLSADKMERVLSILFILFLISYIIQYAIYPKIIFISEGQNYSDDIRIRLNGQGLASLGYFFSLNKLLLRKNKFMLYAGILITSFFVIIIMGFRTMILGIILMTVLMVIKSIGFNYRLIIYAIFFVLVSLITINIPIVSKKLDSMAERQKTENFNNNDYIRVIQFVYFTKDHFSNFGEYIMGSGLPQLGSTDNKVKASDYGEYMDDLVVIGINWVDLGLLSMSWVIGIIPVLTVIFYSIKAFRVKVSKQYYYLGIWFIYLVLISFTTIEIFRPGNLALQAFCFVLIEKIVTRKVGADSRNLALNEPAN